MNSPPVPHRIASVEPVSLAIAKLMLNDRAMFEWFADPNAWVSLLTLTVLEIVLGVDNIIFISILAGKLPEEQQGKARTVGLMLALVTRILLLSMIFLLTKLIHPLFSVLGHAFTGKDLVMLIGGLFLIWKSVKEIHHAMEGSDHEHSSKVKPKLSNVIWTIVFVDILFSLDSVITAVGLVGGGTAHAEPEAIVAARAAFDSFAAALGTVPPAAADAFTQLQLALAPTKAAGHATGGMTIMILAIVISMMVMLAAAKSISDFVNRHPTIKMLALSFLILVGFILVADGFGHHVPKGYVYFAMAFSFIVEVLNIRMRTKQVVVEKPVELRQQY
jgi:predicted tellurium resistance membrane protein TerC